MLELRNPDLSRRHVLAGLWLARVAAPAPQTLSDVLACALELAGEGHALPPIGFVADVALLVLGTREGPPAVAARELPHVEPGLVRRYEDYVLGKLYADLTFERGGDAVVRYAERDRVRGLAWLIQRLIDRTGFEGVLLNPAAIRGLLQRPAAETLREAWELLSGDGPSGEALAQYERLIDAVRSTGDLLAAEDLFELEHGTALVEFGQRIALRQTLRAAEELVEGLPRQRPKGAGPRRQVATRLLDEDAYPVGGFASISTKGSIESLLHSQLAYIEPNERPDLFDVKYVRDELLYYSRDENQFLRRRTTLVVAIAPELAAARIKDDRLPWQRIVLTVALVVALFRKLTEWLSDEALALHLVFVTRHGEHPLPDEQALLERLLSDQIEHGTARIECLSTDKLATALRRHARRSLVRSLAVAPHAQPLFPESDEALQLVVAGPEPQLHAAHEPAYVSPHPGLDAWRDVLLQLLDRSV